MKVAIYRITKKGKRFKNPLVVYHGIKLMAEAEDKLVEDGFVWQYSYPQTEFDFVEMPDEVQIKLCDLRPGMEISRIKILDEERFMVLYDYTREFKDCVIRKIHSCGNPDSNCRVIFLTHIKHGRLWNFSFTAHGDDVVKIYK